MSSYAAIPPLHLIGLRLPRISTRIMRRFARAANAASQLFSLNERRLIRIFRKVGESAPKRREATPFRPLSDKSTPKSGATVVASRPITPSADDPLTQDAAADDGDGDKVPRGRLRPGSTPSGRPRTRPDRAQRRAPAARKCAPDGTATVANPARTRSFVASTISATGQKFAAQSSRRVPLRRARICDQ